MLLSSSTTGRVSLINGVVVKELFDRPERLEYEYQVGLELNKLQHPNLIKTLDFRDGKLYLEYVPYSNLASQWTQLLDWKLLLKHLIYIVLDIQSLISFTHYDLTPYNILIQIGEIENYIYHSGSIKSPYKIKIIDYGYTHVPGITVATHITNRNSLLAGMVPEVFDPLYDIVFLSLYFNQHRFLSKALIQKLHGLGFPKDRENFPYANFYIFYFLNQSAPLIKSYPTTPVYRQLVAFRERIDDELYDFYRTYDWNLSLKKNLEAYPDIPFSEYLIRALTLVVAMKAVVVKNRSFDIEEILFEL